MARRAARRERRRARRQHTVVAGVVLGGLAVASLAGFYNWLGRDPALLPPRQAQAQAQTQTQAPASPQRPAPPAGAAQGLRGGLTPAAATTGPSSTWAAAAPNALAAPAARAPAPTSTAACARPPCLPFIEGAQVIDDGNTPATPGDQALSRSWAATISSSQPMDQVVAYYRQQLTLMQRPGDAPVAESHPGPNQLLLTMTAPQDRAQQSVWIGQAGPQVLIRLVRSLPANP